MCHIKTSCSQNLAFLCFQVLIANENKLRHNEFLGVLYCELVLLSTSLLPCSLVLDIFSLILGPWRAEGWASPHFHGPHFRSGAQTVCQYFYGASGLGPEISSCEFLGFSDMI